MPDEEAVASDNFIFKATVSVTIVAPSKMEAATRLRMVFLSSAVTVRDYAISDFEIIDRLK